MGMSAMPKLGRRDPGRLDGRCVGKLGRWLGRSSRGATLGRLGGRNEEAIEMLSCGARYAARA